MPRKGPAPRRELMPDPVYHSVLVTQVVNKILLRGKRSVAERIVYDAMKVVEEKTGSEPLSTLKRAVENVKPQLEVKSRRVGGATYQVPVEVRPERRVALAMRWLVTYSRGRRVVIERTDGEPLVAEYDGDVWQAAGPRLTVEVLPGVLRALAPLHPPCG